MSEIYYAMIIFPIIFLVTLMFIFQSSVDAIEAEQLKLNCPYPVNSGIAVLAPIQEPPQVNFTVTYDNNTSDYNVTLFICGATAPTSVSTSVYTADVGNGWFDMTSRASGYMFYISQSISSFFQKALAGANMVYLVLDAPAQATGLSFFTYISVVLFSFIAIGTFMIIRGA